ncbi:MAG: hypothetical protein KKD74_13370 [Bacteroidetes bacterium]|nr:hypothetical protein [Bacteroidota bacterium]
MIRYFKSSFAVQYGLILLLGLLIWLPALIKPVGLVSFKGFNPLYDLLASALSPFPLLLSILGFALIFVQAFFFNAIISENNLQNRVGSVGMLVYLLLFSRAPELFGFTPVVFSTVFVLATMHNLYQLYDSKNPIMPVFQAAFYAGMATLCYFPAVVLLVVIFGVLIITRTNGLREWLIPFFGFFTPFFFLASWYFLNNELIARYRDVLGLVVEFRYQFAGLPLPGLLFYLLVLVMLLAALLWVNGNESDNSISTRKKVSITMLMLLMFLASAGFSGAHLSANGLFIVPAAVFITYWASSARRLRLANIMVLLLLALVLFSHYYRLFA